MLRQIITTKFVSQIIQLLRTGFIQGRHYFYRRISKGQIFAAGQHITHGLGGQRRPGTILNQRHRFILKIALRQMINKLFHKRKNIRIIGGSCQNQPTKAECVRHCLRHITARQIISHNLRAATTAQLISQLLHSLFGMPIN